MDIIVKDQFLSPLLSGDSGQENTMQHCHIFLKSELSPTIRIKLYSAPFLIGL